MTDRPTRVGQRAVAVAVEAASAPGSLAAVEGEAPSRADGGDHARSDGRRSARRRLAAAGLGALALITVSCSSAGRRSLPDVSGGAAKGELAATAKTASGGDVAAASNEPTTIPVPVPAPSAPTTAPPPTTSTPPAPTTTPPPPAEDTSRLGTMAPPTTSLATVATVVGSGILAYEDIPAVAESSEASWLFPSSTQFGSRTTFLVTSRQGDWLQVVLPVRQNGTRAWIPASGVSLSTVPFRLVVSVSQHRVALWKADQLIVDTDAVVGTPSTPTPYGLFYVTDLLDTGNPDGAYGPYIVATSARSDAFDWFNGGEPLVGVHGTNEPELLGTAASHGCVRLSNDVITELVRLLPLGTPVHIVE